MFLKSQITMEHLWCEPNPDGQIWLQDKMAAFLADNNFKCIFLNENRWISIRIWLKFVPNGPIDNKPALVQVLAWRRTGNKPLPELMLTEFTDAYMQH